jgi:hypothetical protein
MNTIWQSYPSLGQNPAGENTIPHASDWTRVSLSPTGNKEIWASDSLQLTYEIICD